MYKILGEDKVMVDKLAPERLEAEYSLVSGVKGYLFKPARRGPARRGPRKAAVYFHALLCP